MKKLIPSIILTVVIAIMGFIVFGKRAISPEPALAALAECIGQKGIIMYGADWCPHCQNEKNAFGDEFQKIPYIECGKDPSRCIAAGVKAFPTWAFSDGHTLVGEQGLAGIAAASGCPFSKTNQ
jgi:hypothetical protein